MNTLVAVASLLFAFAVVSSSAYVSELVEPPQHKVKNDFTLPLPHTYTQPEDLPAAFTWASVEGSSFVTKSLNQHLPQYCGSCWAHGALSSLADRVKIARKGKGDDINFAVQYILNCGTEMAGSCHGGSHLGTFEFIKKQGYVPYDTCLQYEACSSESTEGNCASGNYTCSPMNTCRTCSTFTAAGGKCAGVSIFPNATIAEYGQVPGNVNAIKSEIYQRGPIACEVNAEPILKYTGGIFDDKSASKGVNHIVSIIGWGTSQDKEYWIVRNSWGQYWGELGYFRIATGDNQLGIEDGCAWATPNSWTELNFPCYEDASNCDPSKTVSTGHYQDPSEKIALQRVRHQASLIPSL